jgi:hypothetical protein
MMSPLRCAAAAAHDDRRSLPQLPRRGLVAAVLLGVAVLLSGCTEGDALAELSTCLNDDDDNVAHDSGNGTTSAQVTGVTTNGADDFNALVSISFVNLATLGGIVVAFVFLRKSFPQVYARGPCAEATVRSRSEKLKPSLKLAKEEVTDALQSWATASWYLSTERAVQDIGMDCAMLLEFTSLCAKILGTIAVPLMAVAPLTWCFGGVLDGSGVKDVLRRLSMGNIESSHTWLFHIHAGLVWVVVLVTKTYVYGAQAKFLQLRFRWLRDLPAVRASTLLVRQIPEEYRSDAKVREFFAKIFPPGEIASIHVLKQTTELAKLARKQQKLQRKRRQAELLASRAGQPGLKQLGSCLSYLLGLSNLNDVEYYEKELAALDEKIQDERNRLLNCTEVGGVHTGAGFITFRRRREALLAQFLRYSENETDWVVSRAGPPEPENVSWNELKGDAKVNRCKALLGYALVVSLIFFFTPICVFLTSIAAMINFQSEPMQNLWKGYAPTIGLTLFMSFLPTVLLLIFRKLFADKSDTWKQHRLQVWYFWFQVVHVLLVTAIGASLERTLCQIVNHPTGALTLLAEALPSASNFYLKWLVLMWVTQSMGILRLPNLVKFVLFRIIYPEAEARVMAEPEDQDYYGIGARSARFSINMAIGLVFSTISLLIAVFGCFTFTVNRLLYGYLIPFAECRKNDIGGVFWSTQLNHILYALVIYCSLMTGIFSLQEGNDSFIDWVPCVMGTLALGYTIFLCCQFNARFRWQQQPVNQLAIQKEYDDGDDELHDEADTDAYLQPELRRKATGTNGIQLLARATSQVSALDLDPEVPALEEAIAV